MKIFKSLCFLLLFNLYAYNHTIFVNGFFDTHEKYSGAIYYQKFVKPKILQENKTCDIFPKKISNRYLRNLLKNQSLNSNLFKTIEKAYITHRCPINLIAFGSAYNPLINTINFMNKIASGHMINKVIFISNETSPICRFVDNPLHDTSITDIDFSDIFKLVLSEELITPLTESFVINQEEVIRDIHDRIDVDTSKPNSVYNFIISDSGASFQAKSEKCNCEINCSRKGITALVTIIAAGIASLIAIL